MEHVSIVYNRIHNNNNKKKGGMNNFNCPYICRIAVTLKCEYTVVRWLCMYTKFKMHVVKCCFLEENYDSLICCGKFM